MNLNLMNFMKNLKIQKTYLSNTQMKLKKLLITFLTEEKMLKKLLSPFFGNSSEEPTPETFAKILDKANSSLLIGNDKERSSDVSSLLK